MRPLWAFVALLLMAAPPGEARWEPARVLAHDSAPRAIGQGRSGELLLWAGTKRAERFSWMPGAVVPQRSALPPFRSSETIFGPSWAANDRGDAVLVHGKSRSVHALALDAAGARAWLVERLPGGRAVRSVAAAIGADGTAAVAWIQTRRAGTMPERELPFVWIRIRAPGGQFAAAISVPGGGPVRELDLQVLPDGLVQLVHAGWDGERHRIYHTELRVGATTASPVPVVDTLASSPFGLALVPGAAGRGRVLLNDGEEAEERLVSALRVSEQTWAPPQRVAGAGLLEDRSSVALLPDGSAVLAYARRREVLVRRAAPGGPFSAPQRVARVPREWSAYSTTLSTNGRGNLLLAWIQGSREGESCDGSCHERVMAAVAAPDGSFGPPALVSPLGTVTERFGRLAVGISDQGDRLVAWRGDLGGVHGPGALVATHGTAARDVAPPSDRRRPRIAGSASVADLRAAAHGAPLRVSLRCDEPCAIRMALINSYNDFETEGLLDLAPVVFHRAGTRRARWRLSRVDRRWLRRLVRSRGRSLPGLSLPLVATDLSGNLRMSRVKLSGR